MHIKQIVMKFDSIIIVFKEGLTLLMKCEFALVNNFITAFTVEGIIN